MTAPGGSRNQYPYIVTPSNPLTAVYDAANQRLTAMLPGAIYPRYLLGESVYCSQPSQISLYWNAVDPINLFDNSPNGSQNTADYPNPRYIPPGTPIVACWTAAGGITAGQMATITFFLQAA